MALFFDTGWFDAALAARGLARADAARALGFEPSQIAEIWKDQRELSARDVAILAALLGVAADEVAQRAGVSTPVPRPAPQTPAALAEAMADFGTRLERVERSLAEIKALLLDLRNRP